MALYHSKGVVLRRFNLSEKDKVVTVLTEKYGRVKCVARSARKIKSRFSASLEPLSFVEVVFFGKEQQELYSLNQADIVESFQTVREDLSRLYLGIYFCELIDVFLPEAHPEPRAYALLTDALHALAAGAGGEPLCRLFEMRLLCLSGFRPELNRCTACLSAVMNGKVGFDPARNGILCGGCLEPANQRFTTGTLNYLKKLLTLEVRNAGRLKFAKGMDADIERVTHRQILSHLGRELKSYPFVTFRQAG